MAIVCVVCGGGYADLGDKRLKGPGGSSPAGWDRPVYCANGHLLPPHADTREQIVMVLWGPVGAGKGTYLRAIENHLSENALAAHGVTGSLRTEHLVEFLRVYSRRIEPTQKATKQAPRIPWHFTLGVDKKEINLIIFDSAGEDGHDFDHAGRQEYLRRADLMVFLVPPEALPRSKDVDVVAAKRDAIRPPIEHALAAMGKVQREKATMMLVLSKCDEYESDPDFPDRVLDSRDHTGRGPALAEVMHGEQAALALALYRFGGKEILRATRGKGNGTVLLSAVSGTGSTEEGTAVAQRSAPDRALDPIVIALMRAGLGRFAPTRLAR